ncbi:hypothetical protein MLD38_022590 [Melastoma candidum]|uniref:Uncharacterized protein n=1 Tax=Melastoma candidum TaxID=119954 RepID=A0ACB9QN47_9MYRT|nr:hypothetical protein MLD38_022590 [Melastoma candidum]
MSSASTSAHFFLSLCLPTGGRPSALSPGGAFAGVRPSRSSFVVGTPLVIRSPSCLTNPVCKATTLTIRCQQSTQGSNSADVWLGRFAMVGFAIAISVEIATGKGLLENFGLTSPLPTVALAVTGLVGVLAAVFIFQSASKK